MTALATSADVEAALGRTLTAEETARIDAILDNASAVVREATGRKYEAGTYTVRRKARGGKVRLDDPATVTEIVEVDCDGNAAAVTGYTLRGDTVYGLGCAGWVEVTYTTVGAVPDDLVTTVASMAARDLTNETPSGATGYAITKGPFTESATFDNPTEAIEPTPSEARVIRRYALPKAGVLQNVRQAP